MRVPLENADPYPRPIGSDVVAWNWSPERTTVLAPPEGRLTFNVECQPVTLPVSEVWPKIAHDVSSNAGRPSYVRTTSVKPARVASV